MWESFLGSAIEPTIASGIGEASMNAVTPALTDTALNQGIDQAIAGTLPTQLGTSTAGLGMNGTFQALGNAPAYTADGMLIPTATSGMMNLGGLPIAENIAGQTIAPSNGMFGEWGDKAMNVLGSDQFKNATALGVGGFNALNQANAIKNAKEIQQAQLKQSQDAYNRDKSADQRRQKLVF